MRLICCKQLECFGFLLVIFTHDLLKTDGLFRVGLRQSSLNKELEMSKIKSVI